MDEALVAIACSELGVEVVETIGEGGQKSVHRVKVDPVAAKGLSAGCVVDPMSDARGGGVDVVLKVIALGSTSPESLERARREVELLQQIDSRHVVSAISDLVVLGKPPVGAAWLEELLPGFDLASDVGNCWGEERTVELMRQVALGVGEMHRVKVTHRDLSPRNIRVVGENEFVVMDPGFARYELLPAITVIGHPGTPGHMSPEHLYQPPRGPTSFSDVFCIGVLGYLALTGVLPIPFDGDTSSYVNRLRNVEIPPLGESRKGLSSNLARIVRKCLHPQPARRFRNGDELSAALREI